MKKALFSCLVALLSFMACTPRDSTSRSATARQDYIIDLEGYEFVVAGYERAWWLPVQGNSDHEDAMVARIRYVEERYNCTIRFEILSPFDAYEQTLIKIMSGDKPFDVLQSTVWSMGPFIANNLLEPLNRFPELNLDEPYWEPAINELGTFRGEQYLCAPVSFHTFLGTQAFFYNRDMIQELGLQDPQELYLAGEWTINRLLELALAANRDMDGNGVMDVNDRFGISAADPFGDYLAAQFLASGLTFIGEDTDGRMQLLLGSEQAFNVVRDLRRLFTAGVYLLQSRNDNQFIWPNQFTDGKALFFVDGADQYSYIAANCDFDFGILPPPKWDFSEKHYAAINHNAHVLGMLINNPDREKAAIVLEALARQSEREVDINLNEQYLVKGLIPDPISYQYIRDISQKYMTADKAAIMGNPAYYHDFVVGTRVMLADAVRFDTEISTLFEQSSARTQSLINDFWNTRR